MYWRIVLIAVYYYLFLVYQNSGQTDIERLPTIDSVILSTFKDKNWNIVYDQKRKTVRCEMDMIVPEAFWFQVHYLNLLKRSKRNAERSNLKRWPNAVIPFRISPQFTPQEVQEVHEAMKEWMQYTCIQFRQATPFDQHLVSIQDGHGCHSVVGLSNQPTQDVTLAKPCRKKRIIIHELGHSIGFVHEHNRPDRDQYIRINHDTVRNNLLHNFDRFSEKDINTFNVPYDYKSIMHYGENAFSGSGGITVLTKDPRFQKRIGKSRGLSFFDIKLTHLMYNCAGRCPPKSCPPPGFLGKNCQCMCQGDDTTPVVPCNQGGGGGGGVGNVWGSLPAAGENRLNTDLRHSCSG